MALTCNVFFSPYPVSITAFSASRTVDSLSSNRLSRKCSEKRNGLLINFDIFLDLYVGYSTAWLWRRTKKSHVPINCMCCFRLFGWLRKKSTNDVTN